jgi:hypothetical protein
LLWKMNRRRLDFEALRDSLLFATGSLDLKLGGPTFDLHTAPLPQRRTVYGFIDRLNLPGVFRTFDFPNPDATSPQRDETTIAPQALYLMNNPVNLAAAQNLALLPEVSGEADFARRIERVYQLLFARSPTRDELRLAEEFFGAGQDRTSTALWQRYAQALLLTNEFAFVD